VLAPDVGDSETQGTSADRVYARLVPRLPAFQTSNDHEVSSAPKSCEVSETPIVLRPTEARTANVFDSRPGEDTVTIPEYVPLSNFVRSIETRISVSLLLVEAVPLIGFTLIHGWSAEHVNRALELPPVTHTKKENSDSIVP